MSELASVFATAPVRVADVGGWTDTWFGSPGRVCNVAVGPGVTARARLVDRRSGASAVRLVAPDVGADYEVGPDELDGWSAPAPGHHPLLEHAIAAIIENGTPIDPITGIELQVGSAVPAGASLGTSASAVVVVLAALDALVAGGRRTPADLATLAHQIETVRAGREAGVQDQWAAAFGGASLLDVPRFARGGSSPLVEHRPIELAEPTSAELEARWCTVVFGSHDSSAVHSEVIDAALSADGIGRARTRAALAEMVAQADVAAAALAADDVDAWGEALRACTVAQEQLHAALVGPAHRAAIERAQRLHAGGWKVNGAGGGGGSLTVLFDDPELVARYRAELAGRYPTWTTLDLFVSPGVTSVRGE